MGKIRELFHVLTYFFYKKNIYSSTQITYFGKLINTFAAEIMNKSEKTKTMKRKWLCLLLAMTGLTCVTAQTLDECQEAAQRNYPLIKKHDLIGRTTAITVANLQKGWLPQITAQAQATLQSDVTAWPESMQQMMQQMGLNMKGLSKDQYRVGIDVQQTVYDGGRISTQQALARLEGDVQTAQTDVEMYALRQRVNELFFSLLLTSEQLQIRKNLVELLKANEKKLASMFKNGTASESDYNSLRAERLTAEQQVTTLTSQRHTLQLLLSTFCGIEVSDVIKPEPVKNGENVLRPELKLIDTHLRLTETQEEMLDKQLYPRLSVFAQGFYGYPGLNMFEDMMHRRWSLNGLIGARLTWNIGALYTRKNDKERLNVQREMFNIQRETFLFNNRLEQLQQNENITRYKKLIADDKEIISLRQSVRKAAESKLEHGIIDVNDLLKELNSENAAMLNLSIHEIEMLKQMYDLKFTNNN